MNEINFNEIIKEIISFRDKRNWKQFHKVKNLILGLNIEVGELQELFLWKTEKEIEQEFSSNKNRTHIAHELSDIFIFLIYLSNHFNINLLDAVRNKLKINNKKYPVHKSKNSAKKYTKL
jgi:NTP pyrophosphatase (non-canonical NTP hydrolase)